MAAENRIATVQTPLAVADPGMIIKVSQALGFQAGDNIEFQGYVDRDADQAEIDHLCNKMVMAAAKIRAKAMLPNLRHQLDDVRKTLTDDRSIVAKIEAQLREYAEQRETDRISLQKEFDSARDAAVDEHYQSGRRGEFKAPSSLKNRLVGLKAQIEKMQGPIGGTPEAEKVISLGVALGKVKEGESLERRALIMIVENERLAKGEDISGVEG